VPQGSDIGPLLNLHCWCANKERHSNSNIHWRYCHAVFICRSRKSLRKTTSTQSFTKLAKKWWIKVNHVKSLRFEVFTACFISLTFLARWFFSPWWFVGYITPKRRFLQEPHGVIPEECFLHSHLCENLRSYVHDIALLVSESEPAWAIVREYNYV
jgi:hypothetical protein